MPKRQQFHGTADLCSRNPQIAAEQKILQKLMHEARRGIMHPRLRAPLHVQPALYTKYRTTAFPIRTDENRKYGQWRSLSPWMKLQLASMCIAERPHVQIRLRLHDQIVEDLHASGNDYRAYLRDRLTRTLGERFGQGHMFFFVLEDLDQDGHTQVRPHAHGMAVLPPVELEAATDPRRKAGYLRGIKRVGRAQMQIIVGRKLLKEALQAAVGNRGRRPLQYNGLDQRGNVWTRASYNPLFNHEAISYAFKNVDAAASELPANRIARSRNLVTEAQRFWDLVRLGEKAIAAWPDR